MRQDVIFWIFRILGIVGLCWIVFELGYIYFLLKHPQLKRFAWKVCIYFLISGFVRILAYIFDTVYIHYYSGIYSVVGINVPIFWLGHYLRKHRKRIQHKEFTTEARQSLSIMASELLEDMKQEQVKNEALLSK
jgi:hypothetical protein